MKESRERERGIALIVAILALLILSLLGLALATTTSSEVQIATNYRWGQQAYYNAEAGVEFAKFKLNTLNSLATVLYKGDGSRSVGTLRGTRNWENSACDASGLGYGVLLDFDNEAAPYENASTLNFGQGQGSRSLNGAVTLWVRRMMVANSARTTLVDDPNNDRLILTSEGTAPFTVDTATTFGQKNRAVRVLEVTLIKPQRGGCEGGQTGGCPENPNYGSQLEVMTPR
jgi:hypothetical protein